jgi:hypothetical protein
MQSVFVRSHKPLKVELYNVQRLNTRPGSRDLQFEKEEPLPDFEALLEIAYADWTYDHEAGADSQEPAWVYEQEQRRLEISRAREQKQAEGRRARWLWFVRTHYSQIQGLEYMQKVELYWAWLAETGRISERRCRMAYGCGLSSIFDILIFCRYYRTLGWRWATARCLLQCSLDKNL